MSTHVTLAARMREARLATAARRRATLSQEGMGVLVAELIGRTVRQAAWSLYELGKSEPPLDVIVAAAKLSGLDASYLAFGGESDAPLVNRATLDALPPMRVVRETREEPPTIPQVRRRKKNR